MSSAVWSTLPRRVPVTILICVLLLLLLVIIAVLVPIASFTPFTNQMRPVTPASA
jgi:hypothetical protein